MPRQTRGMLFVRNIDNQFCAGAEPLLMSRKCAVRLQNSFGEHRPAHVASGSGPGLCKTRNFWLEDQLKIFHSSAIE